MPMMSSAHHTIHTKIIPKFRLPAGVPNNPVRIASVKTASVTIISVGWNARDCRARFSHGYRVRRSVRGMPDTFVKDPSQIES